MRFDFSRVEKQSKPHSFDLGDITIISSDSIISSRKEENHRMMIYVAISDMIDALEKALKTNKPRKFSGTDSSFVLEIKPQNGKLLFEHKKIKIIEPTQVALNSIRKGIEKFFRDNNALTEKDTCHSDIVFSVKTLESLIAEIESSKKIIKKRNNANSI
ncbi:hypothetical protein [Variovorax boronicumulans]|uniref:hypothetical protein n=1 Tax=Variovorax boronicumulans TaxID=436515 RepID=UPI003391D857